MDILIVSIDHQLQLAKKPNDSPELNAQKTRLEDLLRQQLMEKRIQLIAEESDRAQNTIAYLLAREQEPEICWKNIVMTPEERTAAGIKDALLKRPGFLDQEKNVWIEARIPEDDVREDFFITEILAAAAGAESILLLLGDMHVDAVAKKLTEKGHRVVTDHELVPEKRWR
jgi:hypothetical protein